MSQNQGLMTMVRTAGALFSNTQANDLVIYHQNAGNQVVIGTIPPTLSMQNQTQQHSALTITTSNVIAPHVSISESLTLNGYMMQNPMSQNYAYAIFTASTATIGITAATAAATPMPGTLTNARNGISMLNTNTISMPTGLYACIMTYNLDQNQMQVAALADSKTTFDYGQSVSSFGSDANTNVILTSNKQGSVSFTIAVEGTMQLLLIQTAPSNTIQTLCVRRIA